LDIDLINLSVVVITYNEERNLARCLQSVQDFADDLVVIDSFSTDRTEEIAKQYGARFIQHAFEGHIEQKNWAITQAQFPYILSLDADECCDQTLIEEIKKVKQNWSANGFYMNRLTNYCGHWVRFCGWYPDRKLRLWNSLFGQWSGFNPHDRFEMYNDTEITPRLKGNILHYSYYSIAEHYKQIEYFSTITANVLFKRGKSALVLYLIFSPIIKFLNVYFFRFGFLDGPSGFRIAYISAYGSYLKYKKLRALAQNA